MSNSLIRAGTHHWNHQLLDAASRCHQFPHALLPTQLLCLDQHVQLLVQMSALRFATKTLLLCDILKK